MSTRKRILQFLEYKNISKYEFYKKTGLSNGFLDKGENPGSDKCEIIIYYYPEINLYWLITGKGEMLSNAYPQNLQEEKVQEPLYKSDKSLREEVMKLQRECNEKGNRIIELLEQVSSLKDELNTLKSADGAESRIA